MGNRVPVDLSPVRWGSQPYPPSGYADRWSRNVNLSSGYAESDPGFIVARQIAAAVADKPGSSFIHSGTDGARWVLYDFNGAIYYDEDDASPVSIKSSLAAIHCPSWANMGSPLGMSLRVNGTDVPYGVRIASGVPAAFAANFEKPNDAWTAGEAAGGSLTLLGTYNVRIAQVEVDATTGTLVSGPATVKTVTLTGANARITVAQASWTPNTRATHWRIGITANGETDAPENYFYSADVAIGTTSVNIDTIPTVTPPFESRNGFYKVTSLVEIIASKHPRGVISYLGRWVVWYGNDNRILWSERDEWGWYATNSLDTGAEGGWNLPVRCCVDYNGTLLVFTEAAIHAVFGDFRRDLDGAAPSYAADATPRTLISGIGILGGVEAAKVINGAVYFMSSSGPAEFTGRVQLLEPDDMRQERKSFDTAYGDRYVVCEDPETGGILFLVTRLANSTRKMDGCSTAGIADTIYRWVPSRGVWSAPMQLDLVHLCARTNGTKGSTGGATRLMGIGPHGTVLRLGFGNAGGTADGVVTAATYDAVLASANDTVSATIALAGISADALIGMTLTLRYPSTDSTYPYEEVQKTIVDNGATDGSGNVVVTWQGALTAPSTSFWTVRIGAMLRTLDVDVDPRAFQIPGASAASYYQLHQVEARFKDKVGAEAVS